jgi:putative ABC transport system permease protein
MRGAIRTIWQDVKFALRMLRKNPGFTLVAVLTLGLGIGANTAIFSVVDAVLLRPLPFRDADRLVSISQATPDKQTTGIPVSYTKFTQIQEQNQTFDAVAAYYPLTVAFSTQHEPEAILAAHVSQDFFQVLGVSPALGRTFLPEEEKAGGADVAMVSDAFLHTYFAGDASLLGRTITVDGKNVVVAGILPATFKFPLQFPEPSIWLPREFEYSGLTSNQVHTGAGFLNVIARLRRGETLARAQGELAAINLRYREQFGSYVDATKYVLDSTSLEESLISGLRPSLLVLLAAVGFVLLIACANVANLLLVRATSREREIAIRKALGASRGRLLRQLLIESGSLSVAGCAVGLFLSEALLPLLRSLDASAFPRIAEATISAPVLLFSLALCALTSILFGLAPSLQASAKELQSALKEGGRGSSESGSRGRFRSLLVVGEMGIALVLMTGAGLLMESFAHLVRVDPGFSPANIMTFPINLPGGHYTEPQQIQFFRRVLEGLRALPEVEAAGATSHLPLSGGARYVFFCPEGRACLGVGKDQIIAQRQVTPDYFRTVRTPLLAGRVFNESDVSGGQPVAIINQTTANRYWPNQNAIGKHLANSRDMVQREVVGVVADVKFRSLNGANSEEEYLPLAQNAWPAMTLVVRSRGNSRALVAAVRAKISEVDPTLPVSGILSFDDVVSTSIAQPRLIMRMVGVFAGFAMLLAALGIYGVMAYTVSQRRQELGIRVALGAKAGDILRLVVGQGMQLAIAGIGVGVLVSLIATRLLSSLLFGVHAIDAVAFSGAAVFLGAAAFAACYLPARRAMRVDPITVLRWE